MANTTGNTKGKVAKKGGKKNRKFGRADRSPSHKTQAQRTATNKSNNIAREMRKQAEARARADIHGGGRAYKRAKQAEAVALGISGSFYLNGVKVNARIKEQAEKQSRQHPRYAVFTRMALAFAEAQRKAA